MKLRVHKIKYASGTFRTAGFKMKYENEAARIKAIEDREIGSVRVTLEDSRLAGNCVEGSLAYAEQKLHISRDEIITNGYLFSVPAFRLASDGNEGVKRAVKTAWIRETTISI